MQFPYLQLSYKSLLNRRVSVFLTIISLALSVVLFAGVEKIRTGARAGFETTISGTDLIVGARTGQVNLLLYTVFRIGEGVPGMSWESYELIAGRPEVAWAVPLSLGDSHKGYRVLGTDNSYFEHYKYGDRQLLEFAQGDQFEGHEDVIVGAEVATQLGYKLGDQIRIAHGLVATSFAEHEDANFVISGILKPTGTPVDQTVHVTLEGLEHAHEEGGEAHDAHADHEEHGFEPEKITAMLVGMTSRPLALRMQGQINNYQGEALMAILPGVTLSQLWSMFGVAEKALFAISAFVIVVGIIGMLIRILASLNERRREMAILRALGARPHHIFNLLVFETALSAFIGALLGLGLLYGGLWAAGEFLTGAISLPAFSSITSQGPGMFDIYVIVAVTFLASFMSIFPAWRAFSNSLSDGLAMKV